MDCDKRPSIPRISRPRHSLLIQEEVLSAKVDVVELDKLWPELDSWSFDIFKVANEDLPKMVEMIFKNLGLLSSLPLDIHKLRAFIECMSAQYRSHVPFHNFRHAVDVLHAMYLFLKVGGAEERLNVFERLALAISALCHDVDHPGLTNSFLIACNDPLAIRYNDQSVLENHHASVTVKALMGYESMNVLGIFSDTEQRQMRKLIVTCILATDMAQHGTIVDTFLSRSREPGSFQPSPTYQYRSSLPPKNVSCTTILEEEAEAVQEAKPLAYESSPDAVLLMKIIMKCSDISNTVKPFPLSKKWAALLLLEWFRQGDVERRLGMPVSKNMDRNDPESLQAMTLGCISNLSKPMYEATACVLTKLHDEVLPNLAANRGQWMSFSTAGPIEQEAEIILGSFFPVDKQDDNKRSSTVSFRSSQSAVQEAAVSFHEPRSQETKKPIMVGQPSQSRERPLSLLFGAPIGQDVNTLASELAFNTSLRESSIRVNLVPPARRSTSHGSIGTLQLSPAQGPAPRLSTERDPAAMPSSIDELAECHEPRRYSVDHVLQRVPGFLSRLRARAIAVWMAKALDSRLWTYSIAIPATLIAMFLSDFSKAFFPKSADTFVEAVYLICLFIFLLDLLALSMLKPAYLFSFAFWLDLIGSLTLIPYMFGVIRQNLIVARVWKAAESLSRLAKKLQNRSSRVPSTFLIARLSEALFIRRRTRRESLPTTKAADVDDMSNDKFLSSKPSYLWLRLSDLQSQRLVFGILLLAIVLPYFYQLPEDLAPTLALEKLDASPLNTLRFNSSLTKLTLFNSDHGYEIIYLGCRDACAPGYCSGFEFAEGDPFIQVVPMPEPNVDGKQEATHKYRDEELIKVISDTRRCEAFYSIRARNRRDHMLSMGLTLVTLFILCALSFLLSWDTNMLLIQPIERMVNFIKELADNPAAFAGKSISRKSKRREKLMETRMIEGALVKIACLSKVALGDAGMDILSVNLKGAEFNPMVPGKKIRACFGFCDIRNFTDATECLQEDVMMFVNKIADVVHSKAILHNGFPNKNVGDAFLVVWKKNISDGAQKSNGSSFADRALRSFLDVIQALETSDVLHEYAMHPAIQQRMPGYRIHMGFGLHVGWAIEGAIGSSHKVDPSYLSPHVNMASRLEAATKQYGIMILISETVITNLTKSSLRDNCRKLDRVTVKGSAEPLTLYTYDLAMFQSDLKVLYSDYKIMFEAAVDSYIVGNWPTALEKLRECVSLWHSDKPARLLTAFMGSHKNMVPANWKGYRELSEK